MQFLSQKQNMKINKLKLIANMPIVKIAGARASAQPLSIN